MTRGPYQLCVQDVMSKNVVTVGWGDMIHDVLELFVKEGVSALPVIDKKRRCVGMLSATDLMGMTRELVADLSDPTKTSEILRQWLSQPSSETGSGNKKVGQLMTAKVISVRPDVPLVEAARKMLDNRVHRLPVLDDDRQLLGIISTMDILAAFAEGAPA